MVKNLFGCDVFIYKLIQRCKGFYNVADTTL